MAVIDNMRSAYVSNGGTSALANIFAVLSTWNDERQTRKALNQLSARELEDIGLCRGDIENVVAGTFRG